MGTESSGRLVLFRGSAGRDFRGRFVTSLRLRVRAVLVGFGGSGAAF